MPRSPPRVKMASHEHRVLIYTTCYNVLDGVTLTIRKIEQEILAAGHHVCVVTTQSGDMGNTHMDGVHPNRRVIFLDNAIPIPFLQDPSNPEHSYQLGFSLSKKVKAAIADFEPSIIHVTAPDNTCLHLIQYARSMEIPLMGTYHSNIPEYMDHYPGLTWLKHILGAFLRHQYNFLQALYVPTPYIRQHLVDEYLMDRVTNLGIWGRGIDLDTFSPLHRSPKFRQGLGIRDDQVVVCWVGRLVPEKRPDIFAKVVRRLAKEGIDFTALIIGAGPCEEEMKSLPSTIFAGWMRGDELSTAYASSDLFLFPSSVETFGNVTLEAAASGLPLVVEAGCSGHLVQHGVNGFACEAGDEDAFFEATRTLILNKKRRDTCSRASRQLSLSFEKGTVVRKMLDNYSKVTDEFYYDYGGHHSNRDAAYRQQHSFTGGNHPRPIVLILVEYLFVTLFRVMYQLAAVFLYVQERFVPVRPQAAVVPPDTTKPVPVSKECHVFMDNEDPLDTIPENIEMVDVELGAESSAFLLNDDDDSETTLTLQEDDPQGPRRSCMGHMSPGDFNPSHLVALGFVRVLLLQFRTESAIRNLASSCVTRENWFAARKRKNSSMAFPAIKMVRSDDGSSQSDESYTIMSNGRDEDLGYRMRRSQPIFEEDQIDL